MTEGKTNIPGTVDIDGNVYAVNLLWGILSLVVKHLLS